MFTLSQTTLACATCMSNPNNPTTVAGSAAIMFMLVLLFGVFGGVFQFMRYLSRCERAAIAKAAERDAN